MNKEINICEMNDGEIIKFVLYMAAFYGVKIKHLFFQDIDDGALVIIIDYNYICNMKNFSDTMYDIITGVIDINNNKLISGFRKDYPYFFCWYEYPGIIEHFSIIPDLRKLI